MLCVSKGNNVVPATLGNQPPASILSLSRIVEDFPAETRQPMPEHVGCHANPGNEKGSAETKHCSKNLREEARANSTRPGTPFWGARVGAASLIQESEDSGSRFSWKQHGATAPIQIININLRPTLSCCKWGCGFARRRDSLPSRSHSLMAEAATAEWLPWPE
jgi:hypothetical protein